MENANVYVNFLDVTGGRKSSAFGFSPEQIFTKMKDAIASKRGRNAMKVMVNIV